MVFQDHSFPCGQSNIPVNLFRVYTTLLKTDCFGFRLNRPLPSEFLSNLDIKVPVSYHNLSHNRLHFCGNFVMQIVLFGGSYEIYKYLLFGLANITWFLTAHFCDSREACLLRKDDRSGVRNKTGEWLHLRVQRVRILHNRKSN